MRAAAAAGALLAVGGAALALSVGLGNGDGSESLPPEPDEPPSAEAPVIEDLRATPTAVDEGGWIEFVGSAAPPQGSDATTLRYVWDFGDGSQRLEGSNLTSVRHQFRDGDAVYTVRLQARSQNGTPAERTLRVKVRNVAPEIRGIEREGPTLIGSATGFRAAAVDPGVEDRLTYRWDFGDGTTAEGGFVEHAFETAGSHTVRLVVTDDDGGRDEQTLRLRVGLGFTYNISGDVTAEEEGRFLVSGASGGANPVFREGYCSVQFFFIPEDVTGEPDRTAMGGGMTASLRGGLREGSWPVGRKQQAPRPWRDEYEHPGVFFGDWGRFETVSGSVSIDHLAGDHVEGRFSATLEERTPYEDPEQRRPRTATVQGTFATELVREISGLDSYLCRRPETFVVERHEPARNAANVDPENPVLEVQFDEEVDRSTIHGGTFALEYRLPEGTGESYRALEGEYAFPDERTVRFTPGATLPHGTLLCLRVRGGEDGVRGSEGEVLEAPTPLTIDADTDSRTSRACRAGGRPWDEAYEFGFGTLVELEALRTELYQVARVEGEIVLVPGKPTVARVYPEWSEREDVHPGAQVLRFPARIWVEANGRRIVPAKNRVEVRRPDQYGDEERRLAENSVNFFDWRPRGGGTSDVRSHVEPSDQTPDPARVFEGPAMEVEHWEHQPRFTFDYHFLRIGEWGSAVPPRARSSGRILAKRSEVYTTQMFPVVGTRGRPGLDLHVPWLVEAEGGGWELAGAAWDWLAADMTRASQRRLRLSSLPSFVRALTDQLAPGTDANALVFFNPQTYGGGGTAYLQELLGEEAAAADRGETGPFVFRSVTMYPRGDVYRTTVLTHEFGHSFWLQHMPYVENDAERQAECDRTRGPFPGIEGFRIKPSGRAGWSKSSVHGNAESESRLYPLMYPCGRLATESFVTNEHYGDLLEDIGAAISRGFYTGEAIASADPVPAGNVRIEPRSAGLVRFGPGAGLVNRSADQSRRAQSAVTVPADTRLLVSGLIDETGEVAVLFPVRSAAGRTAGGTSTGSGPYRLSLVDRDGVELERVSFGMPDSPATEGATTTMSYFSVSLPHLSDVQAIVLSHGDRRLARRSVSASEPEVRMLGPAPGATVDGDVLLDWEGEDADGDSLLYSVLYSPTGAHPWRAAAALYSESAITLDATQLEPGPDPTLRVVATDGFHEGEATVRIALETPFPVPIILPAEGDTVGLDVEPIVFLETDVAPEALEGALDLRTAEGAPVPVNLRLDAESRSALLLPLEPLEAGTYTLTVEEGLRDRYGSVLQQPVSVRFHVRSTGSPMETGMITSVDSAQDEVPGAESERPAAVAVADLGPGETRWLNVSFDGRPELSFSGSAVDGTATADIRCSAGSQAWFRFFDGPTRDSSTVRLDMTTVEVISPGATGTFELEQIMVLESGETPAVHYGFGTIEISRHEAPETDEGHRLTGRLQDGSVRLVGGGRVDLRIEFDVNRSCRQTLQDIIGPEPR